MKLLSTEGATVNLVDLEKSLRGEKDILAKILFDTAENRPSKVWGYLPQKKEISKFGPT